MPALLTAIIITCGAMKGPDTILVCRAQVYHGAYNEPAACSQTAQELAQQFERNLIADGRITRTQSYGECVAAADTDAAVSYLPQYMRDDMGAFSSKVVQFDMVDGVAVERTQGKPAKKFNKEGYEHGSRKNQEGRPAIS